MFIKLTFLIGRIRIRLVLNQKPLDLAAYLPLPPFIDWFLKFNNLKMILIKSKRSFCKNSSYLPPPIDVCLHENQYCYFCS